MARKRKINTDEADRADQRRRAKHVEDETAGMEPLNAKAPAYMKGTVAEELWNSIVPILRQSKTIKEADAKTVEALCTAYMLYREAFKQIQENGIQQKICRTLQDSTGEKIGSDFIGYKKNPAVTTMDSAINRIRQLSSDLGLTPTARATLLSLPDANKDDQAPSLADILNGKSDF